MYHAYTNIFRVDYITKLKESLIGHPIEIIPTFNHDIGTYRLHFMRRGCVEGTNIFEDIIMPHVREGVVVVYMEISDQSENPRSISELSGFSHAYIRRGNNIEKVTIYLADIYQLAAERFNFDRHQREMLFRTDV